MKSGISWWFTQHREIMASIRAVKRKNANTKDNRFSHPSCKEEAKSIDFATEREIPVSTPLKKAKKEPSSTNVASRLGSSFYDRPSEELAKHLLGKLLYRVLGNGEVLCGRIVETEGYLGETDNACHSYGGKRTDRSEPLYMKSGTAYVYFIYGMYYCFNISSQEPGACVLIRALEPLQGLDLMRKYRGLRRKDNGNKLKDFQLCNGPSKLCQALCIEKSNLNKEDMINSNKFWVEDDHNEHPQNIKIVTSTRIGIDSYGPEWALKPLRFYILGNKCVSVRDKKAEAIIQ